MSWKHKNKNSYLPLAVSVTLLSTLYEHFTLIHITTLWIKYFLSFFVYEKPKVQKLSKHLAAAAAAKSLKSCPTLCNPMEDSPPGSPSLGFSRQEHWSRLPFPSPMHESRKWKWSCTVVPDSLGPHGLQPTRLLCPWDFPGKSTGVGCHCLLRSKHLTKFK